MGRRKGEGLMKKWMGESWMWVVNMMVCGEDGRGCGEVSRCIYVKLKLKTPIKLKINKVSSTHQFPTQTTTSH